jgi:hypothetical protein
MAEKKSKASAKKAAEPVAILSDKEIVLKKYPEAECINPEVPNVGKIGFIIYQDKTDFRPVHSGIAKSEQEAWKLAAHAVL